MSYSFRVTCPIYLILKKLSNIAARCKVASNIQYIIDATRLLEKIPASKKLAAQFAYRTASNSYLVYSRFSQAILTSSAP